MQKENAPEAQRLLWFATLYVLYQLYSPPAGQLFGLRSVQPIRRGQDNTWGLKVQIQIRAEPVTDVSSNVCHTAVSTARTKCY